MTVYPQHISDKFERRWTARFSVESKSRGPTRAAPDSGVPQIGPSGEPASISQIVIVPTGGE